MRCERVGRCGDATSHDHAVGLAPDPVSDLLLRGAVNPDPRHRQARPETSPPRLRLALVGFGSVNRALARMLLEKREQLEREARFRWCVTGIATSSRGVVLSQEGIDLSETLRHVERGDAAWPGAQPVRGSDQAVYDLLAPGIADVLVEAIPLDLAHGEPATSYIRAALDRGFHVVTANKGPIAHAYRELRDLATAHGRHLRFEATVLGGAPVFSLQEFALPLARVRSLRGILNATSNFVVSSMRRGIAEEDALAEARRLGMAETDPRDDLDGWDAALKIAILVNTLMEAPLRVDEVERQPWPPPDIASADRVWRQEAAARRSPDGRVTGAVRWIPVSADDPFRTVDGTSMALELETDVLGGIMLRISDPTPEQTAYGLLTDLIVIAHQDRPSSVSRAP